MRSATQRPACSLVSPIPLLLVAFGLLGFAGTGTVAANSYVDITAPPLDAVADGMGWADYDGDGDLDVYLADFGANTLLRNDAGTFVDVTAAPLDDSDNGKGVAWADYDNDGDPDLYLSNSGQANKLFRNEGGGVFVDVTAAPLDDAGDGRGVAWGDYDLDGDVDLYLANFVGSEPSKLFRNDGGDVFVDVTTGSMSSLGQDESGSWIDYDGDGDQDLYVTNRSISTLFTNEGDGTFTDTTPVGLAGSAVGSAWGDFDNDGDLDVYTARFFAANRLLRNDGGLDFVDITSGPLGTSGDQTGVSWADYDNDGDLDLYMGGATFVSNRLFRNEGGGTFSDVTTGDVDAAEGDDLAFADYDGDGDLDLYVADGGGSALLRNDEASGNSWLQIELEGTFSNISAIGARVTVIADGILRIREVASGGGYLSQNALTAHFGLGAATTVSLVEIAWPSGIVQRVVPPPAVDQTITVVEDGASIASVEDIGGDQGGWVRVNFNQIGNEAAGTEPFVANYYLWRRVDEAPAPRVASASTVLDTDEIAARLAESGIAVEKSGDRLLASGATSFPPGTWEVVGSAPAIGQADYLVAAPTIADSTETNGIFYSVFVVTSHTTTPSVWYASLPDSGYSVDNIAPGVPSNLGLVYNDPTVDLSWDPSEADDFQYFRIYRGTTFDFEPAPGNLVHETTATSWQDTPPDPTMAIYKITAKDYAGNESDVGNFGPAVDVGDPSSAPAALALGKNAPNPFRSGTAIAFSLPSASTVTLEVFDVQGRLVRRLVDGSMPFGAHVVSWDGRNDSGARVSPGAYYYRLTSGSEEMTRRMTVIR